MGSVPGMAYLPVKGIYRILVCRPNHRLGNMLLLTPLLNALESVYPGAEVDVLAGAAFAGELFAGFGHVRRVHSLGARMGRRPLRVLRTLSQLRGRRYDLVIDAGKGSRSGRIFSRIVNARHTVSPHHDDVRERGTEHFAHRPLAALAAALEPGRLPRPFPPLELRLTAAEREQGRQRLQRILGADVSGRPVVGLFANATGRKRLDIGWWRRLIASVRAHGRRVALVEFLPAHGRSMLDDAVPGLFSTDLRAMAAAMCPLDAFVSADCGVMHLASAAGATTFGLFHSTSPVLYGPYHGRSRAFHTASNSPEDIAAQLDRHLRDTV